MNVHSPGGYHCLNGFLTAEQPQYTAVDRMHHLAVVTRFGTSSIALVSSIHDQLLT